MVCSQCPARFYLNSHLKQHVATAHRQPSPSATRKRRAVDLSIMVFWLRTTACSASLAVFPQVFKEADQHFCFRTAVHALNPVPTHHHSAMEPTARILFDRATGDAAAAYLVDGDDAEMPTWPLMAHPSALCLKVCLDASGAAQQLGADFFREPHQEPASDDHYLLYAVWKQDQPDVHLYLIDRDTCWHPKVFDFLFDLEPVMVCYEGQTHQHRLEDPWYNSLIVLAPPDTLEQQDRVLNSIGFRIDFDLVDIQVPEFHGQLPNSPNIRMYYMYIPPTE